jgi:hypothetical protein
MNQKGFEKIGLVRLMIIHWLSGTEDKLKSGQTVLWPRFKAGISQTQAEKFTAILNYSMRLVIKQMWCFFNQPIADSPGVTEKKNDNLST